MIEPKYAGSFTDRADVAKEFEVGTGRGWADDFAPSDDFPTNQEIHHACYETQAYEGYAYVLYERAGVLYEVVGSHCSCYGLEGQWKPEETTWAALAIRQPSEYGAPREVITEAKKRIAEPPPVDAVRLSTDEPGVTTRVKDSS